MVNIITRALQMCVPFVYNQTGRNEFIYQQYTDIDGKKCYIAEYRMWDNLKSSVLLKSDMPFDVDFLGFDFFDTNAVREAVVAVAGTLFQPVAVTEKGIIYSGGSVGIVIQSQAEDGYMYIGKLLL